ncbi:hypothetical protein Btru_056158 [Bulinus truncatus]|nr:hypothetical protein Btru_056158 [Bulinus truncatus]
MSHRLHTLVLVVLLVRSSMARVEISEIEPRLLESKSLRMVLKRGMDKSLAESVELYTRLAEEMKDIDWTNKSDVAEKISCMPEETTCLLCFLMPEENICEEICENKCDTYTGLDYGNLFCSLFVLFVFCSRF